MTSFDEHRVNELRQRLGDRELPNIWFQAAAKALNLKLREEGDVELPNDPAELEQRLNEIIEEQST